MRLYSLYAKGICCSFSLGRSPTYAKSNQIICILTGTQPNALIPCVAHLPKPFHFMCQHMLSVKSIATGARTVQCKSLEKILQHDVRDTLKCVILERTGKSGRTEKANLVPDTIVIHQEFVPLDHMRVEVPVAPMGVKLQYGMDGGNGTYHAKASSRILAHQRNRGVTTPGLNHVPMPGYVTSPCWAGVTILGGSRTYLVVAQLLVEVILLEQSEELDDVRVLDSRWISVQSRGAE